MKLLGPVIFTLSLTPAFGSKSEKSAEKTTPIQEVIEHYNSGHGVTAHVEKTVRLSLLEETKKSEGNLHFSKGKIRMEISKPDNSVMVVGGGLIWLETEIEGLDGAKKHVTKIKSKDLDRQMRAPLAALFGRKRAWEEFNVDSEEKKDEDISLILSPKQKKSAEISRMSVLVNVKSKTIKSLSYTDDIENEVTYQFSKIKTNVKIPDKKFQYAPPKGAEVVDF